MRKNIINTHKNGIAPCDTHGKFFDDHGVIRSSPSSLIGKNPEINDDAIFSVLQFGAIIPPLSPWKGIHRFVPGYQYQGTKIVRPVELRQHKDIATLNLDQRADKVEQVLDEVLKKNIGDSEEDPVLLFSGGVDSGLIASRLAALGYRNSLLINFSFDDDDCESKLAEKMASELGLPFMRLFGQNTAYNCLENPGKIYPQPFADQSTVPTSDFAQAIVKYFSGQKRIIIDGTGADGAFGMGAKIKHWKRMYRVPLPAITKKAASLAYEKMLWHRQGKFERMARILLRSQQMPPLSAVLAQNPLATAFYSKKGSRHLVDDLLETWVEGWAGSHPDMRIVAGDLALTCANIFAQKAQPIYDFAGHKVVYPFLENEMVSMALSSAPHWQMEEPKAILKRALVRSVPCDMVYRAKSGFVDPKRKMFFDKNFIDHLRCAVEPTSPIAHMLERKPLLKACDLLAQKKELPPQTHNYIWAVVFTDRWYRTA